MRGSPRTLSTTLTIWIVVPIALGFGTFLIVNAARETQHARQQAERECEAWALAVAVGLQEALAIAPADPHTVAAALIARQQAENPMINLQLLDKDSHALIANSPIPVPGKPVSLIHLRKAITTGAPVSYYEDGGRWLTHLQPIQKPAGALRVTMTMEEEYRRIRRNVLTTAAIGLVTMMCVAITLRLLMERLVVHPLNEVVRAVEEIGNGNWTARIPVQSENEIGILARQVNRMAEQRQEMDTALRASEEHYRQTVDQAIDAIFTIDPETGLILDVNREGEQLTGYNRDELCRMHVWTLHPAEASDQARQLWEQVRGGEVALSEEIVHRRKDGSPFIAGVSSGIIQYGTHRVIQRIVRDLTEQKRLAQKKRELELELLQQAKLSAIGAVAQGVAHNLRGPLTVIQGYAELLQLSHPGLPNLDTIIKECHRMNAIIENILLKSRREQEQERRPVNLNELLREEFQFLEADLEFKHAIEKEYHFAENLPPVEGVYSDFSQSLMNIIRNAIDAMHNSPQKHLTVVTRYDDDAVYVEISDTGCGIPAEHLPRIFDPFFTTKPIAGTQRPGEPTGTGLGLSSCVQLLQPYQAKIDVNSEVGRGTTFTVRVPREPVGVADSWKRGAHVTQE